MSESWDDYADDWDTNQDVITYSEKAYDSLCQLISLDGLRVLDFGCGSGVVATGAACRPNPARWLPP